MRKGLSERKYAARIGMSRGAVTKAKLAGRLVLYDDGSINPEASDRKLRGGTDPSKSRRRVDDQLKPVPEAAVAAVTETLLEEGLTAPQEGSGMTFLQAKTAHEVIKAQERRIRLQRLRGELVDKTRATSLVFKIAREERDSWVNWPARVAALMAAELGVQPARMQNVLEQQVAAHLAELADVLPEFR